MMIALGEVDGVVAHSSGNHAQAVARAAKELGVPACIVMPSNAPALKRQRVEEDEAEVVTVGPDSEERRQMAEKISAERGWPLVPPYDDPLIAAGQGTAALELIEDAPPLDQFFCPMSGGGLMAGCATAFAALSPNTEIIGVEPVGADDTARSLAAGERVAVPPPETIADGLRVRVPGAWTWEVNRKLVSRVVLVSDDELRLAMRWAALRLRVVLEPSGAASLAAALREGEGNCGALLSGGNIDPAALASVLA
jgi:threonine dehydratase